MTPEDQRLFARGTGREAVAADLKHVIAHCGSVAEAAACLEVGTSTIFSVLAGGCVGPKVLDALYGPQGCALPADWAAEPAVAVSEGSRVADEGTPVEAAIAAIDVATLGSATAGVAAFDRAVRPPAQLARADAYLPVTLPPEFRTGEAAAPCGCDARAPADAPPDWRPLAIAEFEARLADADAEVEAARLARDAARVRHDAAVAARGALAASLDTIRSLA